jgi:hypothetical protein
MLKTRAAAHNAAWARLILSSVQIETHNDEIAPLRRHPSLPSQVRPALKCGGLFQAKK